MNQKQKLVAWIVLAGLAVAMVFPPRIDPLGGHDGFGLITEIPSGWVINANFLIIEIGAILICGVILVALFKD